MAKKRAFTNDPLCKVALPNYPLYTPSNPRGVPNRINFQDSETLKNEEISPNS